MGLFGKHKAVRQEEGHHVQRARRPIGDWLLIGVIILVTIQIIGLVVKQWTGTPLYLGPGFLLIAVGASVLLAFGFVSNFVKNKPLDKREIIVMVLVFIITALAMIYFRKLLPEVFEPSAMAFKTMVQSVIPIP
jgi:magnesium-transporting ATPase (P-type)